MDELIDSTFEFEDCQAAFERASQKNTYRVVVTQNDQSIGTQN